MKNADGHSEHNKYQMNWVVLCETYQFTKLMECIANIKTGWLVTSYYLILKKKTEILIIGQKTYTDNSLEFCLTLDALLKGHEPPNQIFWDFNRGMCVEHHWRQC